MPRLKILMSAYACEPNKGSEPAVGWNWVLQMARFHDIWVMTRTNNRPNIESFALTPDQKRHLHWVYVDLPSWAMFWKKKQRGVQLYYWLWQLAALRRARKLHREVTFDLAHHVSIGKYWVPSYLGFLPVKSVLGPLGGGESTPPGLESCVSKQGRRYEFARNLARRFGSALLGTRFALRRADIVFATTEQTRVRIKALGVERVVTEPQFAMHGEELDFFGKFPVRSEKPFRLISIGRLLHWKGFHLGLLAFARFHAKHPDSEYWIVSSGPEEAAWKKLTEDLGIAHRVTFWGHLPKISQVFEKLSEADVLVHPALHEAFGNVCLEGLAAGRPVICLNTGGPAVQVTPECGFRAPVDSVEAAVQFMADAMTRLYEDPELRANMAKVARQRARNDFNWNAKTERMNRVYHELCGVLMSDAEAAPLNAEGRDQPQRANGLKNVE
jgi:glycosyltransferase involved in cell wall biosynthesis